MFVVERAGRVRVVRDGVVRRAAVPRHQRARRARPARAGCSRSRSRRATGRPGASSSTTPTSAARSRSPSTGAPRSNPELADPLSARPILTIPHPTFTNHYGGSSEFGPDGLLYVGTGDGGGGGDPNGNAQNLGSLLGKLLRIDPFGGDPYAIPAGNPFVGVAGARPEIFAYGLRNPWRFSFDRATGDLVIGDVGQDRWEEVDAVARRCPAGSTSAGTSTRALLVSRPGDGARARSSRCSSTRTSATACSITGGVVVRDPALTSLVGRYVYGDLCGGEIRSLALGLPLGDGRRRHRPERRRSSSPSARTPAAASTSSRSSGTVYRLAAGGAAAPVPCADAPPETTITSAPASPAAASASFAFASSEAGSSFECRLDAGAWDACSSPARLHARARAARVRGARDRPGRNGRPDARASGVLGAGRRWRSPAAAAAAAAATRSTYSARASTSASARASA